MRNPCLGALSLAASAAIAVPLAMAATAQAADQSAAPSAADVVQAALTRIDSAPHRMTVDGSASARLQLRGSTLGFTLANEFTIAAEVESLARVKWNIGEALVTNNIPTVVFDGRYFIATDGKTWRERVGPDAALMNLAMSPKAQRTRPTSVSSIDQLTELPQEVQSSVNTRHFRGVVRPAFISNLVEATLAAGGASKTEVARSRSAVTPSPSEVDIWTDAATGALVREQVTLRIQVDVAKAMGKVLRWGSIGIDTVDAAATLDYRPAAIGTPQKVARPVARGAESLLPSRETAQDAVAKSLVRNSQSTIESFYIDSQSFVGATPAALGRLERNIRFTSGLALASRNQVQVVGLSATGYTLRTRSASGRTYLIRRKTDGNFVRACRIGKRSCGTW